MSNPPSPQPYPSAPFPGPGPAAPGERRPGNPVGLAAAIVVGVILVVQLVSTIVGASILGGGDYQMYGAIGLVFAILQAILALVAIFLGAVGLAARGRPKALSGIGVGGGAVVLFGILLSYLTNALIFTFSG